MLAWGTLVALYVAAVTGRGPAAPRPAIFAWSPEGFPACGRAMSSCLPLSLPSNFLQQPYGAGFQAGGLHCGVSLLFLLKLPSGEMG